MHTQKSKMMMNRRIINLKDKISGLPAAKKTVAKAKRRGRPINAVFQKEGVLAAEIKTGIFGGRRLNMEPLEISCPCREDILAVLDEIEALNVFMGERSAAEELTEAPEDVLDDLLGVWQVDDFLENESTENALMREISASERIKPVVLTDGGDDFLTALVARPDWLENCPVDEMPSDPLARERELVESGRFYRARFEPSRELSVANRRPDLKNIFGWRKFWRQGIGFLSAGCFIFLAIFGMSLVGQGLLAKDNILTSSLQAYRAMLAAKDSAAARNFSSAQVNFETAYQNFLSADRELGKMGRGIISLLENLPGGSAVGSGSFLVKAGENLAQAGQSFAKIAGSFSSEAAGGLFLNNQLSLTRKIAEIKQEMAAGQKYLFSANQYLTRIDGDDLPAAMTPQIENLKKKMPAVVEAAAQVESWSDIFLEILGSKKAKKYLLVFQNNSEARATGGFIGTYGVADIDEGCLKNLFIDGIFNLDGQLYEKIIPPRPIQKISTAWSAHDANWFADWPSSAKKISWFYEKAGGATVDGVISLTPAVVEKLLAITGPIDLPRYQIALDRQNFMDAVQQKVEIDYDKQLNQPKKILADFAPLFLEKLKQAWPQHSREIFNVLIESLAEKHLLFYFTDAALERAFSEQGWTGEILKTEKDYLSVVNTNINGFKTDKVVAQKIYHEAKIQDDGSIIDTVKIVREHLGGRTPYDWYNKVNADYLRVYVPLGSKLLSASGQTLEGYAPPVDYAALGFCADADILSQESGLTVDLSGAQVFAESGKTVFGNWVYVSPGETVEIIYQYLLPFKIDWRQNSDTYSLLAQKQAGSAAGYFEGSLVIPLAARIDWQYPEGLQLSSAGAKFVSDLARDRFYGLVFGR